MDSICLSCLESLDKLVSCSIFSFVFSRLSTKNLKIAFTALSPTNYPTPLPRARITPSPTKIPSASPTQGPCILDYEFAAITRQKETAVVIQQATRTILESDDESDVSSLCNPKSSQRRALEWVADVDLLQVPTSNVEKLVQRFQMANIFYGRKVPLGRFRRNGCRGRASVDGLAWRVG